MFLFLNNSIPLGTTVRCVAKVNVQQVRFRLLYKRKEPLRKPIWQPIAPSKLYRIKKKEELSPEEEAQRKHLEYTYQINMNSIRKYLNKEFYLPTITEERGDVSADQTKEEENLQQLIEENNQENEKIAQQRQERLQEFRAALESTLMHKKTLLEEENKRIGAQFDQLVRREIERSKTYITKENLEEKIEEAFTHQTNYDYAIDTKGKIIFTGTLHPYALKPKAVPETSSNTEEYKDVDTTQDIYLKSQKLF